MQEKSLLLLQNQCDGTAQPFHNLLNCSQCCHHYIALSLHAIVCVSGTFFVTAQVASQLQRSLSLLFFICSSYIYHLNIMYAHQYCPYWNDLVGPMSCLQWRIAFCLARIIAVIGPLWRQEINSLGNEILYHVLHFESIIWLKVIL